MNKLWQCDWGEFEIPADVPVRFRKDGWFDKRLKITPELRAYFAAMSERLRLQKQILTFTEWQSK